MAELFKYDGEWFGNYSSQFAQGTWIYLVMSHELVYLQFPQMVSNLIVTIQQEIFSPGSCLQFQGLERYRKSDYQ